jgi:hypothetical protein
VRRVKSRNSDTSAVFSPRSAMTCGASSFVVIGPSASRKASSVCACQIAAQCSMSRRRDLLADAFDIVTRIENPDRGINMIQIDDQLP